jgi:hypothetical protein
MRRFDDNAVDSMSRLPLGRVLVIAAVALAAACASVVQDTAPSQPPPAASAGSALTRVHDPGEVTGTEPAHCRFRDGGQLPDPHCTPGSIDPAVTQADIGSTICRAGYTKTVRPPESQTERFKFDEAYPAYAVGRNVSAELDHEIPLELGGSNDASNLWPEVGSLPNPKDRVETSLHHAVCDGRVTLTAAQAAIAANWITAETKLGLK